MNAGYKEHVSLINKQIKELIGIYRDAVKNLDISESEFWVWYTLIALDGDYTQQDICTMWSLPKQTVNTIITHLRLKKYAYFEAVPGRRRHKTIYLTEEGKKYGENLVRPISSAENRAFEKFSAEQLDLVSNAFAQYIEMMRQEFCTETMERGARER